MLRCGKRMRYPRRNLSDRTCEDDYEKGDNRAYQGSADYCTLKQPNVIYNIHAIINKLVYHTRLCIVWKVAFQDFRAEYFQNKKRKTNSHSNCEKRVPSRRMKGEPSSFILDRIKKLKEFVDLFHKHRQLLRRSVAQVLVQYQHEVVRLSLKVKEHRETRRADRKIEKKREKERHVQKSG